MQNFVGQILDGKYRIERELGRGGMGAVYFAYHLGTKRPVALKVIVPQLMKRAEFVERFKREAEAAGRLRHPNVVNVTDFGFANTQEGQVAYLVMEYLDGCTLGEILEEEKKLPLSWTVDILEQVCSAVDEAHRQRIIHRDLKPDNIWLEPNERGGYTAKVLDFGIAKLENQAQTFHQPQISRVNTENTNSQQETIRIGLSQTESQAETIVDENADADFASDFETRKIKFSTGAIPKPKSNFDLNSPKQDADVSDLPAVKDKNVVLAKDKQSQYESTAEEITRVGAIMGTPLYMSPEQCRSEKLSTASDIYSLGVIAYQMLSGRTPFDGDTLSIISGHLQDKPPALPVGRTPRKVKKVVYQALAKDAINRPPTAEVFAGQLRSYSEGIIKIFRHALVIYTENFSKLIWFSLLLYLPTILLAFFSLVDKILEFNAVVSPNFASIAQTILKILNISATSVGETLIFAAVLWIIVQYIETPLRSFSVVRALQALARKWKQFAWILPLRIVIGLFIEGGALWSSTAIIVFFALFDSLLLWALPHVVMMENVGGFAAVKRNWQLTRRVLRTVLAMVLLSIFLTFAATLAITGLSMGVFTIAAQTFSPAIYDLPYEEFVKLMEGPILVLIKLANTFLLPFIGVLYALVYLKARYAGGESTKKLLAEFKDSNIAQSNWQRKIRQRLAQSGRVSNNF